MAVVWNYLQRALVVVFLPHWSSSLCSSWQFHFPVNDTGVWHPTKIGPGSDSVLAVPADLQAVVEQHGLSPHLYADDS